MMYVGEKYWLPSVSAVQRIFFCCYFRDTTARHLRCQTGDTKIRTEAWIFASKIFLTEIKERENRSVVANVIDMRKGQRGHGISFYQQIPFKLFCIKLIFNIS